MVPWNDWGRRDSRCPGEKRRSIPAGDMNDHSRERRATDLARRVAELEAENRQLRDLLGLDHEHRSVQVRAWEPTLFQEGGPPVGAGVTQQSSPEEKVDLFRCLFRGRE